MLISRGADLPLLQILAGVASGLFAFSVIELFIRSVVLVMGAYTQLMDLISGDEGALHSPVQPVQARDPTVSRNR